MHLPDDLRLVFSYNPLTGDIYELSRFGTMRKLKVRLKRGYPIVYCYNHKFPAHHLAWELMTGQPPFRKHVKFKDGNSLNLKWENIDG